MSISVVNYVLKYLRPTMPSTTDYPDATLGYWIDAALLDISRNFPRKTYALWDTIVSTNFYAYADSTTVAKDTTIIRVLTCSYPWVSGTDFGTQLTHKSHLDDDFLGGNYYEADNDYQMLYIGSTIAASKHIYSECHIIWQTSSGNIINPSEHLELIRLFCMWQGFIYQVSKAASSTVPNASLLNSLQKECLLAENSYRAATIDLNNAQATSGVANGWYLDKWDTRGRGNPT